MSVTRRPIPELPRVPRPPVISKDIRRSYPTGRLQYSRAFVGSPMELTLSTATRFPPGLIAQLVTTLNVKPPEKRIEIPFERDDDWTLSCRIVPDHPGLYSFWVRFSLDGGKTWIHDSIPDAWVMVDPPQVDHMRLYTLIPSVSGTISEWSAQLTQIAEMGFNTVHLLPLTTLDTSRSPYSARDLFSVEPRYVTGGAAADGLAELEQFIAAAKALEIRLCFDLVLNHVGVDSNIARQAPEWIVPDQKSPDGFRRAHYYCDKGWLPWNDLVVIDYEHPSQRIRSEIWSYVTEYALFWAHYADQTNGFVRFDNLHSSDKNFVSALSQTLRSTYPNVAVIAEYFTDAQTLLTTVPQWNLNLILATPWDSRFVPQLREYLKYIHSVSEHVRFFMPITSHDSGSPAQEFGSPFSTLPRYVAAALLGTGATGITQGVEWGIAKKIEFIGDQPRLRHEGPPLFGDFLKKVNQVLVAHPVFRRGGNCVFADSGHEAVLAAWRKDDRPGKVGCLVVCNFDIAGEQVLEIDLLPFLKQAAALRCLDLLTERVYEFPRPRIKLTVPPCGAYVLEF